MPAADPALAVAREWIAKAENDLTAAAQVLRLGNEAPTDVVCFHAQQCVEKYMKALLVLAGIDFPKTHDLDYLHRLLGPGAATGLSAGERAELTGHAVAARYPGAGEMSVADARRALRLARRVRRTARSLLPPAAKRRTRKPA